MTKKQFNNLEIADFFDQIADVLRATDEDRYRASAYEKAAVSIEHAPAELKDLWDDNNLGSIPGLGEKFISYIDELFKTGQITHFKEIKKRVPPAFFELINIPGVGGKTALALCKNLKIISVKEAIKRLKKACHDHRVKIIEGFGERSEREILEGIDSFLKKERKVKRILLVEADRLVDPLIDYLKKISQVSQALPLGSIRRRVPTVGDLDIAVSTDYPQKVIKSFVQYPSIGKILTLGEGKSVNVILKNGREVNFRLSLKKNYGSMLQYFTGGKFHNIKLREFALKKNLSLSEYGIKNLKTGKTKAYVDEESFYRDLGLEYIPPQLREDTGEIEKAQKGLLPKIVKLADIRGDLHIHTNLDYQVSHDMGNSSLEEIINRSVDIGYQYLALTDHNPAWEGHNNRQIVDLVKKRKDEINRKVKQMALKRRIRIFIGLEVDIRPDGSLAVPDEALESLDFCIISVHSSFGLSREKMTDRIIKGFSHPKAKILGHPTGRIINQREGYELNWDKIFEFCLRNKKILEVCAFPQRLDLPENIVRQAVQKRIKLCISSDAHDVNHLDYMKYGVDNAARGWASAKDVVNTLPIEEINAILV